MFIRRTLFNIKKSLASLKPSHLKKIHGILAKTKEYHKEVLYKLKEKQIHVIKKFSLDTWKWYGDNHIRMTYLVKVGGKKFVLKATRGFETKSSNSIAFQRMFNDKFDFIPHGYDISIDGYLVSLTEYVKSSSFNEAVNLKIIRDKNIDSFLEQALHILDELDAENIVHCDLAAVNILVESKTNRLFIIDWDTVCSYKYKLFSDGFPHNETTQKLDDGRFVYDDAYSLSHLFRSLNFENVYSNKLLKEIEKKIGKNTFTANY